MVRSGWSPVGEAVGGQGAGVGEEAADKEVGTAGCQAFDDGAACGGAARIDAAAKRRPTATVPLGDEVGGGAIGGGKQATSEHVAARRSEGIDGIIRARP